MTRSPLCRVLGPVRVELPGASPGMGSPQQRLVLAALALAEGRVVSTSRLSAAVWDRDPPGSALVTLRTYVSRIRNALGPAMLETVEGGYALRGVDLDVASARSLDSTARETTAPRSARDLLDRALRLWTGEPLAGLSGRWADAQRVRLNDWRIELLERRLKLDLDLGDDDEAMAELTPLCNRLPLRESARRLLMLALYRTGRQAEALSSFEDYRRRLDTALGARPGTAIDELYRAMLRADDTLAAPASTVDARREPNGSVRLPAAVPDFTGRAIQLAALNAVLRPSDEAPVVAAISGIGGIGKTALATHVAHAVGDRFDAGWLYADLRGSSAAPTEPGEVMAGFLAAMGMGTSIPDDLEERAGLYRSAFADRRALIVLDDAADAAQVRPLLPGAPGSAVLITGRTWVPGPASEHHVVLEAPAPAEAYELFARAVGRHRADAEAEAVRAIVTACGFLPLAVQIAASRAVAEPQRSLAELAASLAVADRRLAELHADGRSVTAAFASSYAKLPPEPARVFRLMAMQEAPAWTPFGAATMLGTDPETAERHLEHLVDLRLLESPAPRHYRFHELVRLYARDLTVVAP